MARGVTDLQVAVSRMPAPAPSGQPAAGEDPAGPETARAFLRARLVRGLSGFVGLEGEWRALLDRVRPANPFLSWEWVSEWGRCFWDERLLTVIVERAGVGPVAIAPFLPRRSLTVPGMRPAVLELMGPRRRRQWWMFELAEGLVDPACSVDALRLILRRLAGERRWHLVEVAGWGAAGDWWREAAAGPGSQTLVARAHRVQAPLMKLSPSWEELRSRLRRNIKESIRRAYNAPARDGLAFAYREQAELDGLDPVIDAFLALHAHRAHASARSPHYDLFRDARSQRFLRGVARRLVEAGLLRVGCVELDGQLVAARLQLEMNGSLLLYQSGFDSRYWQYSVSLLAAVEAIKSATLRGLSEVNFSLGEDQGKLRWDVRLVPYDRLWLVRDRMSSRLLFAGLEWLRGLRDRTRSVLLRLSSRGARPPR
ncbi:MAG TPA: GNAT family N-acetyltransferase [Candidatus Binatia bacterium]|nr:GNAT family N-acetyltransferase [Candidatus Binatia bacterium]